MCKEDKFPFTDDMVFKDLWSDVRFRNLTKKEQFVNVYFFGCLHKKYTIPTEKAGSQMTTRLFCVIQYQ